MTDAESTENAPAPVIPSVRKSISSPVLGELSFLAGVELLPLSLEDDFVGSD